MVVVSGGGMVAEEAVEGDTLLLLVGNTPLDGAG
jgi:hypothetical protein